jgi:predicted ribosomally synthesized peptide with nif11-like leader
MSAEEIKRFNTDVNQDEALKEAVKNVGTNVEDLIALAKSKGYDFTADELQALAGKQGELSEEQLDSVAGGGGAAAQSTVVVYETVVVVL